MQGNLVEYRSPEIIGSSKDSEPNTHPCTDDLPKPLMDRALLPIANISAHFQAVMSKDEGRSA